MDFSGLSFLKIENNEQGVWTLTIDRPKALNALNVQILNEMASFLRQIGEMDYSDARGLIITGSGEKAFVAGADIKEISELNVEQAFEFAQKGQSVFQELSFLKIPVIAAVNGFALGGGCELALACDYIYASENAKFGLPEVSLGLIPGFAGTVQLTRAIGFRKAREMIFTGKTLTAQEAYAAGLVNQVCPARELMSGVRKSMDLILDKSPLAVSQAKRSILQSWDLEMDKALSNEAELFSGLFNFQDVKEGTAAFIEKRKAQFKGE
ncbi:MAG TPA: enoyl-CoA hydratase-related protein [Pseudobdellovibrionaceae bacterium]|nr:enoyl-CoA hydratase-related protein [Pseudobdellovibrionaceae bacterium]